MRSAPTSFGCRGYYEKILELFPYPVPLRPAIPGRCPGGHSHTVCLGRDERAIVLGVLQQRPVRVPHGLFADELLYLAAAGLYDFAVSVVS